VRVVIPEGSNFSLSVLDEAQQQVFKIGVFSAVKVTHGAPNPSQRTIPVVVQVREAPFRTIRVGGGIGFDNFQTELPRVIAQWTNRNFFGDLRRFSFSNRLALVFVPKVSSPEKTGVAITSSLQFLQPSIIGEDIDLTSILEYSNRVSEDYDYYNVLNGSLGLLYDYKSRFSILFSYNIALSRIKAEAGASVELDSPQALDKCTQEGAFCRLTYLEQRAQYDRRNDPINPRRGWYASLSVQEGSHLLGGSFDYLRFMPELRGYWPAGAHVIAARGMAGWLFPKKNQTPSILTRFFLGGTSHRGFFGSQELSPVQKKVNSDDLVSVGGQGMLAASLETRFTLPAGFGIVPFLDAGQVTSLVSDLALNNIHYAAGIGLRYRTPFGPIRLDVARRLNNPPVDLVGEIDRNEIMLLWEPWAIHLSIGEAF
jgi:translocation and assembly module TamA